MAATATIQDREAEMAEWNEARLDDLREQVSDQGTKTEARFDRLERKVDQGFARIDAKFAALHQMLFKAAWGLAVGLVALVGGLIGLIASRF